MTMTEIMARATDMAERNTPGVAFKGLGVLLENLFLGVFACVGWVLGRSWFHGSQLLYASGLAFADGYKKGTRYQPPVPSQLSQPPQAGQPDLLDDSRIMNSYDTPFGVPYGPNVQASSERG